MCLPKTTPRKRTARSCLLLARSYSVSFRTIIAFRPATTLLNRNDVGVVVAPSMIQNEVVVKFRNHLTHFSCPVGWIENVLHSSELEATTEILWDEERPMQQPWLGPDDKDLGVGARVAYLGHWEWYRGDMVPKDVIHTGDTGMVVKKPYISGGRKYVVVRFENCKKVRPVRAHRLHLEGTVRPELIGEFAYGDRVVRLDDGEEGTVVAGSPKPNWLTVKMDRLSNGQSVRDVEIKLAVEPEDRYEKIVVFSFGGSF